MNEEPTSFSAALKIVDHLAQIAGEDLDLVARAIQTFTVRHNGIVAVDIKAAERLIHIEMDAKEFE